MAALLVGTGLHEGEQRSREQCGAPFRTRLLAFSIGYRNVTCPKQATNHSSSSIEG